MRYILVFLLIITGRAALANNSEVPELRALYYMAGKSEQHCDLLYRKMSVVEDTAAPILLCYKGAALLVRCKYLANLYAKYAAFSKGKQLLELAISRDPGNVEIRFTRFCIQAQAPRVLGYYREQAADKKIILRSWKSITDNDLKDKIKQYMLQYGSCSLTEKLYLQ